MIVFAIAVRLVECLSCALLVRYRSEVRTQHLVNKGDSRYFSVIAFINTLTNIGFCI